MDVYEVRGMPLAAESCHLEPIGSPGKQRNSSRLKICKTVVKVDIKTNFEFKGVQEMTVK
jgi:hypothetical protein